MHVEFTNTSFLTLKGSMGKEFFNDFHLNDDDVDIVLFHNSETMLKLLFLAWRSSCAI